MIVIDYNRDREGILGPAGSSRLGGRSPGGAGG